MILAIGRPTHQLETELYSIAHLVYLQPLRVRHLQPLDTVNSVGLPPCANKRKALRQLH